MGTWDYVSVTYDGKPFDVGDRATITITEHRWTIGGFIDGLAGWICARARSSHNETTIDSKCR